MQIAEKGAFVRFIRIFSVKYGTIKAEKSVCIYPVKREKNIFMKKVKSVLFPALIFGVVLFTLLGCQKEFYNRH